MAPTAETVGSYARFWLDNIAPVDMAETSVVRYATLVNTHIIPGLGNIPLKDLDGTAINSFYADRRNNGKRYGGGGLSSTTMSNLHRVLAMILKSAVKAKKLAASPMLDVQTVPKPRTKKIVILDEAELGAMLRHLKGGQFYIPAMISACTGLRRGEALALRWDDVKFEKRTLRVAQQVQNIRGKLVTEEPKSDHSRRTLRMPGALVVAVREHKAAPAEHCLRFGLGKPELVMTDPVGRQLNPNVFSKAFSAAAKAVKPIRFHALRHTHITHLLRNGVPVHVVSARAGHANPTITLNTYAHLLGGDDASAAQQADEILARALK